MTVELVIDPQAVRFVSAALGRWANFQHHSDDRSVDGRPHYAASFPTPSVAATELVRFGRHVEVIGPDQVRAGELARLGEELVAVYRRPG